MNPQILDEARRVAAAGVNRPLLAYWKARLEDIKNDIIHGSPEMFRELRGRALEAEEFIKILESVKE
jgi:hypothetical protein